MKSLLKVGKFRVGNMVWWEDDGYALTGKIAWFINSDKAMILTDCGKVYTSQWIINLNKGKCSYLKY